MASEIQLSSEQIVAAAVDILHEGGLDAVSMRSVAGRLGVTPPPVYARIGNKDALLDAIAEHFLADLAPDPEQTRGLAASGATAVAYETVEDADGRLPLLAPMSEVAGKIATQAGAYMLQKPEGGRGILLGGVPGVAAANVMVIGGGVVGMNAAFIAIGMEADVFVFDRSIDRLRELDVIFSGRCSTVYSTDWPSSRLWMNSWTRFSFAM